VLNFSPYLLNLSPYISRILLNFKAKSKLQLGNTKNTKEHQNTKNPVEKRRLLGASPPASSIPHATRAPTRHPPARSARKIHRLPAFKHNPPFTDEKPSNSASYAVKGLRFAPINAFRSAPGALDAGRSIAHHKVSAPGEYRTNPSHQGNIRSPADSNNSAPEVGEALRVRPCLALLRYR
jgi:hypothetical protein